MPTQVRGGRGNQILYEYYTPSPELLRQLDEITRNMRNYNVNVEDMDFQNFNYEYLRNWKDWGKPKNIYKRIN
jgi:hypothetical protein